MSILSLIAQTGLEEGFEAIVSLINKISALLCLSALVYCAYCVMTGRVENLKTGILGAGIAAMAWTITKFLFETVGGDVSLPSF